MESGCTTLVRSALVPLGLTTTTDVTFQKKIFGSQTTLNPIQGITKMLNLLKNLVFMIKGASE